MQNWVVDVVREMGALGVALLMVAENLFPPLPSEIIMPLAGYLSARGQMSFWLAVVAGTLGSLVGACFWYWIGRRVSRERLSGWVERHGAWLAMTPEDVAGAVEWFHGHGRYSVLLARLVPVVRTFISIPAGLTGMPLPGFLLLSVVGTALWTLALAYAGWILGARFAAIERYVGLVSWVVIAGAVVWYVYRVVRIRSGRRS